MAAYDLTPRLIPFLDRHMILPLLEFLQEKQIYSQESLLQAKLEFAAQTKMIDLYASEYKLLHQNQEPVEIEAKRNAVYQEIDEATLAVGESLLSLIRDEIDEEGRMIKAAPALSYRDAGHLTIEYLQQEHHISMEQIEALYRYAQLSFAIGRYRDAADYLFYYRELMKAVNEEKSYWALWGKLAGEILMANMEVAWNDLTTLYQLMESKSESMDQLEQLQQRTWIIHWALFIFFNLPNGKNLLIEFFLQDKSANRNRT